MTDFTKTQEGYVFMTTEEEMLSFRACLHAGRLYFITLIDQNRVKSDGVREHFIDLIKFSEAQIGHLDKLLPALAWPPHYDLPYGTEIDR